MAAHKKRQKRHLGAIKDVQLLPAINFTNELYPDDISMSSDYQCSACWKVLQDTMVCRNGHRCCASCIKKLANLRRTSSCPMCRDVQRFMRNPSVDAQMLGETVACPFKRERPTYSLQCQWKGTYKELRGHVHDVRAKPAGEPEAGAGADDHAAPVGDPAPAGDPAIDAPAVDAGEQQ